MQGTVDESAVHPPTPSHLDDGLLDHAHPRFPEIATSPKRGERREEDRLCRRASRRRPSRTRRPRRGHPRRRRSQSRLERVRESHARVRGPPARLRLQVLPRSQRLSSRSTLPRGARPTGPSQSAPAFNASRLQAAVESCRAARPCPDRSSRPGFATYARASARPMRISRFDPGSTCDLCSLRSSRIRCHARET